MTDVSERDISGRDMIGRDSWIEAGLKELGCGGVEAVRVEVVAQRLGVTKGGFYRRFKDAGRCSTRSGMAARPHRGDRESGARWQGARAAAIADQALFRAKPQGMTSARGPPMGALRCRRCRGGSESAPRVCASSRRLYQSQPRRRRAQARALLFTPSFSGGACCWRAARRRQSHGGVRRPLDQVNR
jgi:AcrR family transcriptional regulator